jgi:hypothetical protein
MTPSELVPCGNQGGFRYSGSRKKKRLRMVVLYTSGADPDWPDELDRETGLFTYFGDNRADLVAIWRTANDQRFQNYRSTFTVLDVASVPRAWITELVAGEMLGPSCPTSYRKWADTGAYTPLEAPRNIQYRTREQQQPESALDAALVKTIYDYFRDDPYEFEACAVGLWKMQSRSRSSSRRPVGRPMVGATLTAGTS